MADDSLKPSLIASLSTVIRFGRHNNESSLVIGAEDKTKDKDSDDKPKEAEKSSTSMSSMTAYQSILSLAAEIKDPELVYQLIFLTNQNAI